MASRLAPAVGDGAGAAPRPGAVLVAGVALMQPRGPTCQTLAPDLSADVMVVVDIGMLAGTAPSLGAHRVGRLVSHAAHRRPDRVRRAAAFLCPLTSITLLPWSSARSGGQRHPRGTRIGGR
jgi:hypothetical protein